MADSDERTIGPPEPHVIETEVRGDISLYDARNEQVLVLNGTASDIWRLCDGEETLDQIVTLLSATYGVEADAIRHEVKSTVARFIDEGFLPQP